MTSEANTSCLREREMRARGTGDGVFANDNCRRLNDNHEPRQMDITNLAMTGRSSCRRPAILVDVDHKGHASCFAVRGLVIQIGCEAPTLAGSAAAPPLGGPLGLGSLIGGTSPFLMKSGFAIHSRVERRFA